MAAIELVGVRKAFGPGAPVLHDINLRVEDREIVSLLGPSGSGKSTLLRIVAGLEMPDAGAIKIDEAVVNEIPPPQRDIAMVFQSYALYPHMSVAENIGTALRLRGVPRDEIRRRVGEVAALLDIESLLERRPRALSGGQRQRVALARAIVRQPKAFLLDEPLSNLDPALRERTRAELKTLFRAIGATVLYVTHDQLEALTLSDRMAVLLDGVLEQVGAPAEVYQRPVSIRAAQFVGSPPINLLPFRVADGVLRWQGLTVTPPRAVAEALRARTREVLGGWRPEDILLHRSAEPGHLTGRVTLVELAGPHTIVTVRVQDAELKALTTLELQESATVGIALPPERAHWFDRASGQRLA
ncbi:MAG: ABC transporter ATP-binding protein [Deltaproteobacteria bacterium]|nr:ABC transporter ATP-binding protein [Deltaproteobacteria bacterium]